MFSEPAWEAIARSLKLSGRELQIVRAVFDDETEFCIAAELGISAHTVHTYVERLHRKLAVNDRGRLILRVVDEFLRLTAAPDSILPAICANRTAGRCPLRAV
jgi:DNA-binding NarL/FixJ family response regulator